MSLKWHILHFYNTQIWFHVKSEWQDISEISTLFAASWFFIQEPIFDVNFFFVKCKYQFVALFLKKDCKYNVKTIYHNAFWIFKFLTLQNYVMMDPILGGPYFMNYWQLYVCWPTSSVSRMLFWWMKFCHVLSKPNWDLMTGQLMK